MSLVEISFFMPLMVMLQCASLTLGMLGNFSCFFLRLLIIFIINFYEKFFLEYHQSVKHILDPDQD